MNRRALIAGCGTLAVANFLPTDPTYARRIGEDGFEIVRMNDRWFLAGEAQGIAQ